MAALLAYVNFSKPLYRVAYRQGRKYEIVVRWKWVEFSRCFRLLLC